MAMIAIVADSRDEHRLRLGAELERRGVRVAGFAPGEFPACLTLSMRPAAQSEALVSTPGGEVVDLRRLDGAFIRHSADPKPGAWSSDPAFHAWTVEESAAAIDALLLLLPIRFVPAAPSGVRIAHAKPLQIARAAACGLSVPRTLVTNDAAAFASFFEETRGEVVSKTLAARRIDVEGEPRFAFTHAVRRRDLTNLHALRNGPVLLQEKVPKLRELRITIVGEEVFAGEVDSQAAAATRDDWRRMAEPPLEWQRHELPRSVREALSRLMVSLGLSFGCIDMILTPGGEHVFLEVNPLGDWLFIEERLGFPITSAIADLLLAAER
jgi:hypothetical protein